jgi:hypothetical protein
MLVDLKEFSLDDIVQSWDGFVTEAQQLLGKTAARELWSQYKENHLLLTPESTETLEFSKLEFGKRRLQTSAQDLLRRTLTRQEVLYNLFCLSNRDICILDLFD